MPPRRFSRHALTLGFSPDDDDDNIACIDTPWPGRSTELQLTEREPYRFRELPDNRLHKVREGDSLMTLASRYFDGMPRPAGLWWVIADFQPQPITDPTVRLRPGAFVVIPSIRTVQEDIFSTTRRRETNIT